MSKAIVGIDVDSLMEAIVQQWPLDEEHYPVIKGMGETDRSLYLIGHILIHMVKTTGEIATLLESAQHAKSISVSELQELAAKSVRNGVRVAAFLGLTATELCSMIEIALLGSGSKLSTVPMPNGRVGIDLDALMSEIVDQWQLTKENYPIVNAMNDSDKDLFFLSHIHVHMGKTLGEIAAVLEPAQHAKPVSLIALQQLAAKSVRNALRLAAFLGISASELCIMVEMALRGGSGAKPTVVNEEE